MQIEKLLVNDKITSWRVKKICFPSINSTLHQKYFESLLGNHNNCDPFLSPSSLSIHFECFVVSLILVAVPVVSVLMKIMAQLLKQLQTVGFPLGFVHFYVGRAFFFLLEVAAASTSELVNLVLSCQTVFFFFFLKCEHPFIDNRWSWTSHTLERFRQKSTYILQLIIFYWNTKFGCTTVMCVYRACTMKPAWNHYRISRLQNRVKWPLKFTSLNLWGDLFSCPLMTKWR